jgi:error-prone DNA polymerase
MGFYSPSTIVEDARRHGVEVRPVGIRASDWDCTLEPTEEGETFAVRLGLRYVKGLGEANGERILAARGAAPFLSLADVARRTGLDAGALQALAEAGAFDGLETNRRTALWEAKALAKCGGDSLPLDRPAPARLFVPLDSAETIRWDYQTTDLSPRGHPLEAVRAGFCAQGLPDAATVARLPHGRRVRYAGAVICRQQPGTAKGVVFLTLEDETGFVNVVLWPKVWTKCRVLVKTSPILGVTGRLESQQGVAHLIAESVWIPQFAESVPTGGSRDFQ